MVDVFPGYVSRKGDILPMIETVSHYSGQDFRCVESRFLQCFSFRERFLEIQELHQQLPVFLLLNSIRIK